MHALKEFSKIIQTRKKTKMTKIALLEVRTKSPIFTMTAYILPTKLFYENKQSVKIV